MDAIKNNPDNIHEVEQDDHDDSRDDASSSHWDDDHDNDNHHDDDENEDFSQDDDELQSVQTPNREETLNSYIFSQEFLPTRYDRQSQSDLPLKIITIIQLAINLIMLVIFITTGITNYEATVFGIILFGITCVVFTFAMFWLNYKINIVLMCIYRLFLDLDCIKKNNKYYSGLEIPDFFVQSQQYPNLTIQIPVYKENLNNTIKPTLLNCCREADRYMDETGAICNIIICDDGYNLISEAERNERVEAYRSFAVGFTARPHPSKYPRRGRFKKAGNLNFSMNYGGSFYDSDHASDTIKSVCEELVGMGAAFGGDTRYGDYIFLVDSDTRLPNIPISENGCLKRLAKEMMFDGQEVLFIQCYTGPYLSVKSSSEKSVFHHTCSIYNSILISTAIGSMAPLVGHNAFLNMKALTACATIDESNDYYFFWAEDRISEDFELMMRGCDKGYTGRYASHAGIFLEGVSFSYMTEYFKISKFACGAAELIYNPMTQWWSKGIISADIIGFIYSKEVEWYNKLVILAYILNFIALAAAHFGLIFNMFFCEWLYEILPILLMPVSLMWEAIFIWTIVGGALSYAFGIRLGFDKWSLAKQSIREAAFLTCLYGSVSVRFSIMSFTHLFGWNLSFGATSKDNDTVTLMDWIKSTPMESTVYTFYTILMIIRLLFLTEPARLAFVLYFGCVPLMWTIFLFWAGPIFWDILPRSVDKSEQASWVKDDMMFVDKYLTQVPNSTTFKKIKVGANFKLAPSTAGTSDRGDLESCASGSSRSTRQSYTSSKSLNHKSSSRSSRRSPSRL